MDLHPDELFELERKLARLKPEEAIWLLAKHLPYVSAIESEIKKLNGYGKMQLTLDIRGGCVNKAEFVSIATWIKDKNGNSLPILDKALTQPEK